MHSARGGMSGLLGALLCASSATLAQHNGFEAVYRIEPTTLREVLVVNQAISNNPAARTVALHLWPIQGNGAAPYRHYLPAAAGNSSPISVPVRKLSATDLALARMHPFEQPFKRVHVYWGCGKPAGRDRQPRTLRTDVLTDVRLSARLAPSPVERDAAQRLEDFPQDKRMVASQDIRFPDELRMNGPHELRRGHHVTRFDVSKQGEFLAPLDIANVARDDDGSIEVQWKKSAAASAYFVNMFIHQRLSPDVYIWTSSRTPEAGWLLSRSHPGGEQVKRLLESRVLLDPETDRCSIPAAVTRHAGDALVIQVHAYAAEMRVAPRVESGAPALSVRIAPRATSSVMVDLSGQDNVPGSRARLTSQR